MRAWCGKEQTPLVEQVAQIDPEPDRNDAAIFLGEPAVAQEFHKRLPLGVFAADQTEQTKADDDEEAGLFAKGPHNRLPGTILISEETQEPPSVSSEPCPQKFMPSAPTNPEPGMIPPPATEDSGPQFMSYCVDEGDAKVVMPYVEEDFKLNTDIDFSDAIRREQELENEYYLSQPHDNQLNAFRQLGLSDNRRQWISGLLLNVVPCQSKWNEKARVDQSTLIQANSKTPLPVERPEPKGRDIKQTDDQWSDLEPGRPDFRDMTNLAMRLSGASPSKEPNLEDQEKAVTNVVNEDQCGFRQPGSEIQLIQSGFRFCSGYGVWFGRRALEPVDWSAFISSVEEEPTFHSFTFTGTIFTGDRPQNTFDKPQNTFTSINPKAWRVFIRAGIRKEKSETSSKLSFPISDIFPFLDQSGSAAMESEMIDTIWPFNLIGESFRDLLSILDKDPNRRMSDLTGPSGYPTRSDANARMQELVNDHNEQSGPPGNETQSGPTKKRKDDKPSHLSPERVHGGIQ
ncbi:MAG: hypothetical protein ACJ8FY_07070 [Gemmataceae bacterium]